MDKLPKGWKYKAISDIAIIKGGKRIPKGCTLLDYKTDYPYIRVSDFNDNGSVDLRDLKYIDKKTRDQISNYTINSNDLYISIAGTIGKTGIIPKELDGANLTENAAKLVFKSNIEISKWFVLYFTQSNDFKEQAGLATRVVAMPKLALSRLSFIQIPLPASLSEQTRIVNKLDSLFERIDKSIALLEENIKHTEALMASVLDEVFEQAENNKKFEIKLLKDAVRVINGRAYKQQELLNEGKYPVIRVGNFFSNRSWYYSDLELDEDKYCDNGDLLYAWSASFGPKIWDGDRSIFHYHIWKMEIISPNLLKDYLYYMLLRDTEKIKSEGGRGVGMIHITKGDIEVRKITLPPLVNQNQIVDKIKVLNQNLEKLLTEQQSKLNYLKALKASLLDKAFKGEL